MDVEGVKGGGFCRGYEEATASRRGVLKAGVGLGMGLLPWFGPSALGQVRVSPGGERSLVVVFLRGGADGLNLLVPHGEDGYYRARPTLGIPARRLLGRSGPDGGRFGWHPAFAPLVPFWESGELAAVPACGSGDASRSHFEAMATMERGAGLPSERDGGGWLSRYVALTPEREAPLRALALGRTMPDSLRGASGAIAAARAADLALPDDAEFVAGLAARYGAGSSETHALGRRSLEAAARLKGLADGERGAGGGSGAYPDTALGAGLREVAALLRAGVGLEIACLDHELWDTHVAQGGEAGWQASLIGGLASALAAFAGDLGPRLGKTTVLVMTEFGRRVQENAGLGTDHGRAGLLMVLGGGVRGGRTHGAWPGLEASALDEVGDLPPANDYRGVLAGVLTSGLGFEGSVFGAGVGPLAGLFGGTVA